MDVCFIIALPVAHFYQAPILTFIVPLTAFGTVLAGFTPVTRRIVQKRYKSPS